MPRFSQPQLIDRALAALDEAAATAVEGPIKPDKALTFVFAFLHAELPDKKVLPELWKEMQTPLARNESIDFGRRQTINNLAGHTSFLLGRKPA